jgi:hypothetical protein
LRPDGKEIAKFAIDAGATGIAHWVALLLRFDGLGPLAAQADLWRLLPVLPALMGVSLAAFVMVRSS